MPFVDEAMKKDIAALASGKNLRAEAVLRTFSK